MSRLRFSQKPSIRRFTPVHSAAKQMCQFLLPRQKIGATWVLDKHFFLVCKCETTTSNANASKTMGWIYFMGNILIFSCSFFSSIFKYSCKITLQFRPFGFLPKFQSKTAQHSGTYMVFNKRVQWGFFDNILTNWFHNSSPSLIRNFVV